MSNSALTEANEGRRQTPKRMEPFQVDYEPVTAVEEDEGENYHDDVELREGRLEESNLDTMSRPGGAGVGRHCCPTSRKRGHRCCFILCDMRRAVLLADALYFTVNSIVYYLDQNTPGYYLSTGHAASLLDIPYPTMLHIQFFSIYMGTLCGMVGALYYKAGLVGVAGLFHAMTALWRMFILLTGEEPNMAGRVVTSLLFCYPHVFYVYEVMTGILTRENYVIQQEQSYCYGC